MISTTGGERGCGQKLDAGAHFVMTQPIYESRSGLVSWSIFGSEIPVPVMIGILPLQSSRHAEFLHNEVPGITLTDTGARADATAGADGRPEGVEMARELLARAQAASRRVST